MIGNSFPEIGEQVDSEGWIVGPKSPQTPFLPTAITWKWCITIGIGLSRNQMIFGSILRYKRHKLDFYSTDYPVWLIALFSVKGCSWFFVSGPAIIKIFMDNWPIHRFLCLGHSVQSNFIFTVKILGCCRQTTPFRTLPAQLAQVLVCFGRVSAGRATLLNFRQKSKFLKHPNPSWLIALHDQRFVIYRWVLIRFLLQQ